MALHAQELTLHPLALSPRQEKISCRLKPGNHDKVSSGIHLPGVQLVNALMPTHLTEFGTVRKVSPEQSQNVSAPILSKEVGSVREVSPVQ